MRATAIGGVLITVAFVCGYGSSSPAPLAHARELELCVAGEKQIGIGEIHVCSIWLGEGTLLHTQVTQLGADVATTVLDPQGVRVLRVDYPGAWPGSEEPLYFVARETGRYRIELTLADEATAGERYQLDLWPQRPADASDVARAAGTAAFARGRGLARGTLDDEQPRAGNAWQEAKRALESSVEHWRAAGDSVQAAFALEELARVHDGLGQPDAALGAHKRADESFSQAGHPRLLRVAFDLGLRALRHNPELALASFQEYQRAAERWGTPLDQNTALQWQAGVFKQLGREDAALRCYEQALELSRRLGDPGTRAATLAHIGRLFTAIGEHRRAIGFLEAALGIQERLNIPVEMAVTLNTLGDAERRSGRVDASLRHFARSLDLLGSQAARTSPDNRICPRRGVALLGKARGHAAKRKDRVARGLFVRALKHIATCQRPDQEAVALGGLGMFYVDSGRSRTGLDYLDRALVLRQKQGDAGRGGQASAHYALARAFLELGDLLQARDEIQQAIELVESLWQSKSSRTLRSVYLNSKQRYYDLYVEILMRLGEGPQAADLEAYALEVNGRRRARTLRERLKTPTEDLRPQTPELRQREDKLWHEMIGLEQHLDRVHGAAGRSGEAGLVEKKLQRLYLRYDSFESDARRHAPTYRPRPRRRATRLREIQDLLDEETMLLEYSLGERVSFVWRVTHDSFSAYRLAPRDELESLAQRVHGSISDASRGAIQAHRLERALAALSSHLLPPSLAAELSTERLALVKDGALHFVPFALLPMPVGHPLQTSGGSVPLIIAHEFLSLPSAGILQQLRKSRRQRGPETMELTVFADAAYVRGEALERVLSGRSSALASEVRDSWSLDEESFIGIYPQLGATREEGEEILRLVPGNGRAFFGTDVHRDAVLREIGRPGYLHFAVHGYNNPVCPEYSGLVFSRFNAQGQPIPSLLSAREIHRLSLAADLVVLSSCGSGLGRQIRGEGLVGLTQAFLGAGARRVVVSLWNVSDQATSVFMRHYYDELFSRRLSVSAALRATQIWMSRLPRWREPRFWAGFVLHGDWQ